MPLIDFLLPLPVRDRKPFAMPLIDFLRKSISCRLSPYKIAEINALTSKLAGRYFYHFAWLVD
jgi:hypothetical protein